MCEDQDWKTVNEEVKGKGVWTDLAEENQSVKETICEIYECSSKGIHSRGNG